MAFDTELGADDALLLGIAPVVKMVVDLLKKVPALEPAAPLLSWVITILLIAGVKALPSDWQLIVKLSLAGTGATSVYHDWYSTKKAQTTATKVEAAATAKDAGMSVEKAVASAEKKS